MFYTLFDIQATGVNHYDRPVEIALLQMDDDGRVLREYETLIQPERPIENTGIHGVTDAMVAAAPTFSAIAETVSDFLNKSDLLLAFNLPLRWRMLGYAYLQALRPIPDTPARCVMALLRERESKLPRRLRDICASHGVSLFHPHRALPRVKALAKVMQQHLDALPHGKSKFLRRDLENLPTALAYTREQSREESRARAPILERLTSGLGKGSEAASLDAYFELLDLVFADSVMEPKEALALFQRAAELGMSSEDTARAHERYVQGLLQVAYQDGYYTEMEAEHLEGVARALKVEEVVRDGAAEALALYPRDLRGKRVCFTGSPRGRLDGRRVTQKQFAEIAKEAGMTVRGQVNSEVDYLVFEDAESDSAKLDEARRLGVTLVSEQVFWNWLGVQVL